MFSLGETSSPARGGYLFPFRVKGGQAEQKRAQGRRSPITRIFIAQVINSAFPWHQP